MHTILQDLRYGFRLLRRSRGFAFISIITLALGIGLTTTMFSIVYGALLRGLPFGEAERVVIVQRANPSRDFQNMGVPIHDLEAWQEQQRAFEGLAGFYQGTVNVSGTERAERYDGGFVSANLFQVLRERAAVGRVFHESDGAPGAEPVVIIGHDLWKNRYGSDPGIVGRHIRANGVERLVVGVMPEGFFFPMSQVIWLPHGLTSERHPRGEGMHMSVVGRLREGVSLDEANVQMGAIAQRLALEYPETNEGVVAVVKPFLNEFIPAEPRALLYTMLGAVFFVLLIACVNVANLLLSRAALRMREVGIRSAIGAGRRRVVMQFLTEPLAMAILGAALGVALAWLGIRAFNAAIAGTNPPYWIDIRIDGPILLFVLALTLFVTVASGLLPAIRATSGNMNEILKDETRGSSSFQLGRLTRGLVMFELALSCALLVAAGLMVKSVAQLQRLDFGFEPDEVFTARVGLPEAQYPDTVLQVRFFEELSRRLAEHPGLEAVALGDALPGLGSPGAQLALEGSSYAEERDHPYTRRAAVTPGFFDALGVELREGRDFTAQDGEGSLPVAIVNESFVRKHFPDGEAVGRRLRLGGPRTEAPWLTIVGVAPDLYMSGVENEDPDGVYVPVAQNSRRFLTVFARGHGPPLALASPVRDIVAAIDADVPIYFVDTLGARVATNTWFYRVFGTIFVIMGIVALFLAAIGVYGVMSFSVSRRTREMGVRMALGATGADVLRLVLHQGVRQLAIGLTVGILIAAGLSQLLAGFLFQVQPRDPIIFGAIVALLALIGAAATLVPARRATRVDPMVALRYE